MSLVMCKQCKSFLPQDSMAKTGYKKANGEYSRGKLCYSCESFNRKAAKVLKSNNQNDIDKLRASLKAVFDKILSLGYTEEDINFPRKLVELVGTQVVQPSNDYIASIGSNRPAIEYTSVKSSDDTTAITEPTLVLPTAVSLENKVLSIELDTTSDCYNMLERTHDKVLIRSITTGISNVKQLYCMLVECITYVTATPAVHACFSDSLASYNSAITEAEFIGECTADILGYIVPITEETPNLALRVALECLVTVSNPDNKYGTIMNNDKLDKYTLHNHFGIISYSGSNLTELKEAALYTLEIGDNTYANPTFGAEVFKADYSVLDNYGAFLNHNTLEAVVKSTCLSMLSDAINNLKVGDVLNLCNGYSIIRGDGR